MTFTPRVLLLPTVAVTLVSPVIVTLVTLIADVTTLVIVTLASIVPAKLVLLALAVTVVGPPAVAAAGAETVIELPVVELTVTRAGLLDDHVIELLSLAPDERETVVPAPPAVNEAIVVGVITSGVLKLTLNVTEILVPGMVALTVPDPLPVLDDVMVTEETLLADVLPFTLALPVVVQLTLFDDADGVVTHTTVTPWLWLVDANI